MTTNQLIRQIRREATANPKKAGILGLLLVVALWFWAPLVWGWVAPEAAAKAAGSGKANGDDAGSPGPDFAEVLAAAKGEKTPSQEEEANPGEPWHVLLQTREQDPLTKVASLEPYGRDPFVEKKPEAVEEPAEPKAPEPVAVAVTPESVGIALSGTIVGPRRRTAFINGHSYREGAKVERVKEGQRFVFRVAEIRPQSVVLARDGKSFEVNIPPRSGG